MAKNNDTEEYREREPSGVPLGGVGAGCIEMGRDGRLRNITINNNRTRDTRIDVSEGAFLAVRSCARGKVLTRILQPESKLPFERAGIVPTYTPAEQLSWRGLYPCAHYRLDDAKFPIEVSWSAMAPIIPFATEASTLPAVFFAFYLVNPSENAIEVSVVINWENLCGCSRDHFPEQRGPMRPVAIQLEDEDEASGEEPAVPPTPIPGGLEFGFRDEFRSNAEGNYCLVAKQQEDIEVSVMGWDESNPAELEAFWQEFHDRGHLGNRMSRSPRSHSGAVCCSLTLEPKHSRRILYALSWYCPRFVVNGVDLGNGYTNKYARAVRIAEVCLRHHQYFLNSVESWQKRLLSSSLPRWFSKMLINNNCTLSTNTLYTKEERFAMLETPGDPVVGALDRRLYSSIGTLLFFPDFEHRELLQFTLAKDPQNPGRLYRNLGRLCLHEPSHEIGLDERMDLTPAFVLMVYRNYCMTGNRVVLKHQWPCVKESVAYLLTKDRNGDGLPEQAGYATTFDEWPATGNNSYAAGLWLAALRAYVKLAQYLGEKAEVVRVNVILAKALDGFEEQLWDEQAGCYRWSQAPPVPPADGDRGQEICHSAQLAGQWYADFLCLGRLLPDAHVQRAIRTMSRRTERAHGVALAASLRDADTSADAPPPGEHAWPAFYAAYYASLLLYHGKADRGLYMVQKTHQDMHAIRGLTYNQPMQWDLGRNIPSGWGIDRYMASSSVWYVFYALQGFLLNLPEKTIWIRPNLPKNVYTLQAPLFTPSCLGWLNYREEQTEGYVQTVEISLDSPVHAKTFVLRIPDWVEEVDIRCVTTTGEEPTRHFLGYDAGDHLVEIQPTHPVVVGNSLALTVTGKRFKNKDAPAPTAQ